MIPRRKSNRKLTQEKNIANYVELPFPPSVWKLYFGHARGKTKSKIYKEFITECNECFRQQDFTIEESFGYKVYIDLCSNTWMTKRSTLKKKDLDNYLKAVLDCMTTYLELQYSFDDSQILEINVRKIQSFEEKTKVWVESIDIFAA